MEAGTIVVIVLFGAGVAGIVRLAVAHHRRGAQKRAAAIRDAAVRLGWGYRERVAYDEIPDLERFELFRPGRNRKLGHLLTSPPGDPRAVVFEYTYTTGGGNSQMTHRQTVFYATGEALRLPTFSLRPEHFFHRVGAVFGMQDIDLEQRPEFSRMFLLRGEDEARVRNAFTDRVAEFFERRQGSCAAGLGRELLFWRARRVVKSAELEAFIREGMELAERFTVAAGPG